VLISNNLKKKCRRRETAGIGGKGRKNRTPKCLKTGKLLKPKVILPHSKSKTKYITYLLGYGIFKIP